MAVALRRNRAYLYELRGIIHNEEPFAMPDVCLLHDHVCVCAFRPPLVELCAWMDRSYSWSPC